MAGGVEAEVVAVVVGGAKGEGVYDAVFVFEIEIARLGKSLGAARIVQSRPRQVLEEVGVGFYARGEADLDTRRRRGHPLVGRHHGAGGGHGF